MSDETSEIDPPRLHPVEARVGEARAGEAGGDVGSSRDVVDGEEPLSSLDRWVLPYFEDMALWPVLIVIVAHIVAFVAPVLLFAVRDRRPVGFIALGLLAFGSYRAVRYDLARRGRPAAISALVATVWGLSAATAYFANVHGLL